MYLFRQIKNFHYVRYWPLVVFISMLSGKIWSSILYFNVYNLPSGSIPVVDGVRQIHGFPSLDNPTTFYELFKYGSYPLNVGYQMSPINAKGRKLKQTDKIDAFMLVNLKLANGQCGSHKSTLSYSNPQGRRKTTATAKDLAKLYPSFFIGKDENSRSPFLYLRSYGTSCHSHSEATDTYTVQYDEDGKSAFYTETNNPELNVNAFTELLDFIGSQKWFSAQSMTELNTIKTRLQRMTKTWRNSLNDYVLMVDCRWHISAALAFDNTSQTVWVHGFYLHLPAAPQQNEQNIFLQVGMNEPDFVENTADPHTEGEDAQFYMEMNSADTESVSFSDNVFSSSVGAGNDSPFLKNTPEDTASLGATWGVPRTTASGGSVTAYGSGGVSFKGRSTQSPQQVSNTPSQASAGSSIYSYVPVSPSVRWFIGAAPRSQSLERGSTQSPQQLSNTSPSQASAGSSQYSYVSASSLTHWSVGATSRSQSLQRGSTQSPQQVSNTPPSQASAGSSQYSYVSISPSVQWSVGAASSPQSLKGSTKPSLQVSNYPSHASVGNSQYSNVPISRLSRWSTGVASGSRLSLPKNEMLGSFSVRGQFLRQFNSDLKQAFTDANLKLIEKAVAGYDGQTIPWKPDYPTLITNPSEEEFERYLKMLKLYAIAKVIYDWQLKKFKWLNNGNYNKTDPDDDGRGGGSIFNLPFISSPQ